jgi:hypothetical protein
VNKLAIFSTGLSTVEQATSRLAQAATQPVFNVWGRAVMGFYGAKAMICEL